MQETSMIDIKQLLINLGGFLFMIAMCQKNLGTIKGRGFKGEGHSKNRIFFVITNKKFILS